MSLYFFRIALLCFLAGCTAKAAETKTVMLSDLPTESLSASGVWQSGAWTGSDAEPWIQYNGRVLLRLEHRLGRVPSAILVYLSFSSDGRSAALSAGDMAHIISADEQFVEISNQTNSDFYARVVLY
ncbi:MAG: hypothetical protein IPJ88_11725 [Myxococcales bacterium]|nr:MAG: hypothetical protein IPJ88_11725 [Myxococcales bacterium]